jgi:hypothetical protein
VAENEAAVRAKCARCHHLAGALVVVMFEGFAFFTVEFIFFILQKFKNKFKKIKIKITWHCDFHDIQLRN